MRRLLLRSSLFYSGIAVVQSGGQAQGHSAIQPQPNSRDPSPFEYVPVTALDDYGQSTQLKHAMESAIRHGTPVLACLCCNDDDDEKGDETAILVCSLQRPRLGVIAPKPKTSRGGCTTTITTSTGNSTAFTHHPSIEGLVQQLATRDDVDVWSETNHDPAGTGIHALHTAIVSTGIRSDALFLLGQLQQHLSQYWFRYDSLPSPTTQMVKMARDVLLDFLGYDRREEMSSLCGVGSAAPSYAEDEDGDSKRAGRPLGVCSFILGFDTSRPTLTSVKANGSSEKYVAQAMGIGSPLANDRLSKRWRRRMPRAEAHKMMGSILREIAIEKGWASEDDDHLERKDLTLVSETVTVSGIELDYNSLF